MRTIAKKSTSSAKSEGGASSSANGTQENWFRMHWRLVLLCLIGVLAFVLRFAFSYGVSAGNSYALSGGTSASSHQRIITEILWGTFDPSSQSSMNYPYGIESVFGPLFDYCCAAWAKLFSVFGMSYNDAASLALAVNPPIFGTLTIIPVYLAAKKFFKDDLVGVTAAAFYAVFPILVMTAPFSYGSELPFVCFLFAWMIYFAIGAFDAAKQEDGIKAVFTQKAVLKWAIGAAVMMTLIVYSWTGYWAIVMAASLMLLVTVIVERIGGRGFGVNVGLYVLLITVPVLLGTVYYTLIGAWNDVCSGACVLAVLATVYSVIFLALEKKSWVLTIPVMAVIMIAVAVAIYFVMPSLSTAILSGNSGYVGTLIQELVAVGGKTSISAMASYYGWLTVWFPLFYVIWMVYNYRKNAGDKTYFFVMTFLFACYCAGWYSFDCAVLAGTGFAIAAGAVCVKVIRHVNLKAYFRSLKGNGFKAGARKALNFFPLVTVLVAVLLIAAPTAVYAVDAATPTNNEGNSYFGGLGYSINTTDTNMVSAAWSNSGDYLNSSKDATLLTWYGYSDSASSVGGFKTVTSSNGSGASVMSSALLSNGSAGAVASLLVRLLEKDAAASRDALVSGGMTADDADSLIALVSDESAARKYISDNHDSFLAYNDSLAIENLAYLAGVDFLTGKYSEKVIGAIYASVAAATGNSINYIAVDGSMIPLYAGDGTYASYLGYFGDYALDNYGAPAELYTVTSTTSLYYQYGYYDHLYYTYNNAMYETFLWNALLGVVPGDFGYTSNLDLINALGYSDGTVKANAGAGLSNFKVSYWHVKYQAADSDSWTDMDVNAALAEQARNGGHINYLASVVVLEYGDSSVQAKDGQIVNGTAGVENIKVAVFEKMTSDKKGYDPDGSVSYVLRSTAVTDKDGKYSVFVPTSGDYLVKYYCGSTGMRDGTVIKTLSEVPATADTIDAIDVSGFLVDGNNVAIKNSGAYLTFVGSNGNVAKTVSVETLTGAFTATGLIPDTYTVNVYSASNALLNTVSIGLSKDISDLRISAAACGITVNLYDEFGMKLSVPAITATVVDSNNKAVGLVESGNTLGVLAGTYTVKVDRSLKLSSQTVSVKAAASGNETVNLYVYGAAITTVDAGTFVSGIGYSDVSSTTSVLVPTIAKDKLVYYEAVSDTQVKIGFGADPASQVAVKVSGTLKDASGNAVAGSIAFVDKVNNKGAIVFGADSNGAYSAVLPAGDYVIYATNGSNQAVLENYTVSSAGNKDIQMKDASALTLTVKTSASFYNGAKGFFAVPVDFKVIADSVQYEFYGFTNNEGKVVVCVPNGSVVDYTVAKDAFVTVTGVSAGTADLSGNKTVTESVSDTLNVLAKADSSNVPSLQPANGLGMTVKSKGVAITVADTLYFSGPSSFYAVVDATGHITKITSDSALNQVITGITPGSYSVSSDTKAYNFSGTVDIFPESTEVDVTLLDAFTVTVTKVTTTDSVEVVAIKDSQGNAGTYRVSDNKYYLEKTGDDGLYEYYFKITGEDGKVFISDIMYSGHSSDISGYTVSDIVTVSGYVGSQTTGDAYATCGSVVYHSVVTSGTYSFVVPKGVTIDTIRVDGKHDLISVDSVETVGKSYSEDGTYNFAADSTVGALDFVIAGTMDNGVGNLTVNCAGLDADSAYYVSGSSAFILDTTYLGVSDGSGDLVFSSVLGHYNAAVVGAGSANATITVTKLGEKEGKTAIIPANLYTVAGTGAITASFAKTEGASVNDTVDSHTYKYAVALKSTFANSKNVTITATTSDAKWKVAVTDSDGYLVWASGSPFEIAGLSTSMLYVMLMCEDDSETTVPNVSLTVTGDGLNVTENLEAQAHSFTESAGSVSGGNSDNNKVGLSTGFWILTVLTILVLLLGIYGGIKRGVFSRKN